MSIVVMKFGGTSLADAEKIRAAARRAIRTQKQGHQVVMIVSAMGKTTDALEDLANKVMRDKPAPKREWDQLMSTGEQVTISLMAMALEEMGSAAISFTAGQIGMVTDDRHTKARIKRIAAHRIHEQLDAGRIAIVAGFQGVTEEGHVTTLGRGGSNVTLVAIAAALKADLCENYTDVDGVYTADPRIVPNGRKISKISYDEMLELASLGVNVLHNRAVEFAKKYNVPIHVRNSAHNRKGTMIVAATESMERIVVSGAALKEKLARVSLSKLPDHPGVVARVFHTIARHDIMVDDIIQTISDDGTASLSFTVELAEFSDAKLVCAKIAKSLKCDVSYDDSLSKVSVVGVGMRVHTGVAEKMFSALADAKINIENITTSEIKISCMIDRADGKKALRVVHDAFELGGKKKKTAKKRTKRTATKKK
ncbi:MAG: aspartate kinase [Phycisphaerae bacterium]|nr:aspartate kinase [Phycisphaerae bacterium]